MTLWIPFTLAAATFQTARFMLQKYLSMGQLSAAGATFSRFVYSAPLILLGLVVYMQLGGHVLPALSGRFFVFATIGGLTQILATVCVVLLFKARNFAVGITFKKTEVILSVLVGLIVLGEGVSLAGLVAILVGVLGVLLLSKTPGIDGRWFEHLGSRAVALGLASGLLFAISAVSYRGATLELDAGDPLLRAGVTLAVVVCWQTLVMAIWLVLRDPGELRAVWQARRVALWVGLTSMGGSLCWFVAFALQTPAYVKALGQVELILSLIASVLFFKETITAREIAGMALLVLSILGLVLVI
ncbi:MAG: DMT family transporter [Aestuariivita sp.]|uniref:EamA family transporter n=1 Tax=Aestuariivita sp. TaxID=1872407 RepID=UPI003BB134B4